MMKLGMQAAVQQGTSAPRSRRAADRLHRQEPGRGQGRPDAGQRRPRSRGRTWRPRSWSTTPCSAGRPTSTSSRPPSSSRSATGSTASSTPPSRSTGPPATPWSTSSRSSRRWTSPRSASRRTARSAPSSRAATSTSASRPRARRSARSWSCESSTTRAGVTKLEDLGHAAQAGRPRSAAWSPSRTACSSAAGRPARASRPRSTPRLREIDRYQKNIITVEDPIEYHLDNITQMEINTKGGQTFAAQPAVDPPPGPRRHHDRRDPRPGDRVDRLPGGQHRPHGLLDRPLQRRRHRAVPPARPRRRAVHDRLGADGRARPAAGPHALRGLQGAVQAQARVPQEGEPARPTRSTSSTARRPRTPSRSARSAAAPATSAGPGSSSCWSSPSRCAT